MSISAIIFVKHTIPLKPTSSNVFVWRPSWIVSMATGGVNYKIQCLSTFLSNELTIKPKQVDIILTLKHLFCTVVSGLNCRPAAFNCLPAV